MHADTGLETIAWDRLERGEAVVVVVVLMQGLNTIQHNICYLWRLLFFFTVVFLLLFFPLSTIGTEIEIEIEKETEIETEIETGSEIALLTEKEMRGQPLQRIKTQKIERL